MIQWQCSSGMVPAWWDGAVAQRSAIHVRCPKPRLRSHGPWSLLGRWWRDAKEKTLNQADTFPDLINHCMKDLLTLGQKMSQIQQGTSLIKTIKLSTGYQHPNAGNMWIHNQHQPAMTRTRSWPHDLMTSGSDGTSHRRIRQGAGWSHGSARWWVRWDSKKHMGHGSWDIMGLHCCKQQIGWLMGKYPPLIQYPEIMAIHWIPPHR